MNIQDWRDRYIPKPDFAGQSGFKEYDINAIGAQTLPCNVMDKIGQSQFYEVQGAYIPSHPGEETLKVSFILFSIWSICAFVAHSTTEHIRSDGFHLSQGSTSETKK